MMRWGHKWKSPPLAFVLVPHQVYSCVSSWQWAAWFDHRWQAVNANVFVVAPSRGSQILPMNSSQKRCRQHMSSLGVLERTSASCDCRHHHKFNTTALSVTLPVTRELWPWRNQQSRELKLLVSMRANVALSPWNFFSFPARTKQWRLPWWICERRCRNVFKTTL